MIGTEQEGTWGHKRPNFPPPAQPGFYNLEPDAPLTYVFQETEGRPEGPLRLTVPDSQRSELVDRSGSWQEAPDPIRQSDFWAAGNKIHPWAQNLFSTNLAIPYQESISEQTFRAGKLIGYLYAKMFQGHQLPSDIRANIQTAVPTTYGSLYEVSPTVTHPGPAYTATGFEETGATGDPYW